MIDSVLAPSATKNWVKQLIPSRELKPGSIEDVLQLPSFFDKMKECEKRFKTKYSEIDHSLQNALVLRRLQQMINTVMLNPHWKERIEQSGLKKAPVNFEEWQQLPISDKVVQHELFMGSRPGLVVPLTHGDFEIVASGGTSGGLPVETVYSLRELHDTYKIAGDFMGQYVLKDYLEGDDPKWVITTLADYQMWSSGTMVGGVLQSIPEINYIGAGPVLKEVFQHLMSYKGPKVIMSVTQGIAILSELGKGLSEEVRRSLRVAMYGSGVLSQRQQSDLRMLYPDVAILSYFAATQAETIGLQLRPESPLLAAVPGLHLIEIVDENGQWVDVGEEGELVVTRLHAHRAPFLRYKVGDRMIRRPNLDGPGLKTQQLEFSGRSGDVIHIRDIHFSAPRVFSAICNQLKLQNICDLKDLAHEIQFSNNRKMKTLTLVASVDDVQNWTSRINYMLGAQGLRQLFVESLIQSLSVFNSWESNVSTIDRTQYTFEINIVKKDSEQIFRTQFGKVPLLKDVL